MAARKITTKDELIWKLLQDPLYRVARDGTLLTKRTRGGRGVGPWRRAGWVSPSRGGEKVYRHVQYHGEDLYEHRIIFAAIFGHLSPFKTINHDDLNGLNNRPRNLELTTPGENIKHAMAIYRRSGMSAAEAKANWIKKPRGGGTTNWMGIKRGQHETTD